MLKSIFLVKFVSVRVMSLTAVLIFCPTLASCIGILFPNGLGSRVRSRKMVGMKMPKEKRIQGLAQLVFKKFFILSIGFMICGDGESWTHIQKFSWKTSTSLDLKKSELQDSKIFVDWARIQHPTSYLQYYTGFGLWSIGRPMANAVKRRLKLIFGQQLNFESVLRVNSARLAVLQKEQLSKPVIPVTNEGIIALKTGVVKNVNSSLSAFLGPLRVS